MAASASLCAPLSRGAGWDTPGGHEALLGGFLQISHESGAFDFSTRIKEGGRKRPPPTHKAPQCGAFPDSA